jgi:hypothetical protein
MDAIRNMNWTWLVPAFKVADYLKPILRSPRLFKECIPLLPTRERPRYLIPSGQPGPGSPGGAVLRVPSASDARPACHQGLALLGRGNQNLGETSKQFERINFRFEAQDGMAATWKVGAYLVSSFSALAALLVCLFALPVYPIVGALLVIGSIAFAAYAGAGLCGVAESKNESREESNWGKAAIKCDRRPSGWSATLGGSFLQIMHQMKDLLLFDSALSNRRCRLILSTQ